jgi:Ca2+-dependent lipid-binding protein
VPSVAPPAAGSTPAPPGPTAPAEYKLEIQILKGAKLKKDFWGTDPYVQVLKGDKHIHETAVIKHNVNPVWNDEKVITVVTKEEAEKITFKILDKDLIGSEDLGCATVMTDSVFKTPGERDIPIMLKGKQDGILTVKFTFV